MKILLFTHKNDIDGMGSVILSKLVFDEVDYVLCGTFELDEKVLKYYDEGFIYNYDMVYITDLCLKETALKILANDDRLKERVMIFDHHKTFDDERYTKYSFVNVCIGNENGLCSGTSLFYDYLVLNEKISSDNLIVKEFVELTRQHDTWEWKTIYNNDKARELALLFDVMGNNGYIDIVFNKLYNKNDNFEFDMFEIMLINNRIKQIEEKIKFYLDRIMYKEILGMKAGIVFIDYDYRNELAEYLRENLYDIDFVMMVSMELGVVSYRSIKDGVIVRIPAEYFGGKGHDKAASNSISDKKFEEFLNILLNRE